MTMSVEWKRKPLHISMGLFALALRWLDWRQAAVCALVALAFNLFLLRRLTGDALLRDADKARGYPLGIVLYPIVVLALIVVFRHRLELAAVGWGYLAFGDGFAGLFGKAFGRTKLPWNEDKSWAGLLAYVAFGGLAGAALFGFVLRRTPSIAEIALIVASAGIGAIVESLPSELDDNATATFVATLALWAWLPTIPGSTRLVEPAFLKGLALGVAVNAACALLAGAIGVVARSAGWSGFLVGTVIFAFGGWKAYGLLWLFFGVGTLVTRLGKRRKERMGKAQEKRGAPHVFANCSVAAFLFVIAATHPDPAPFALAAAAAFATALMDTIGTEVGQAVTSPTVLLPDFRRVPPGTDGAVSVVGTLAGLAGALLVGVAAAAGLRGALIVVAGATFGTVLESLLGREGAPWRVTNGHVLNFTNTLAGAAAAFILAR